MNAELRTIDLPNGERIGYRERAGGDVPVLLLHGNMTSSVHWDLVFEEMNPKYHLYAMDMRGFGASSYETPIDSIADFAEDVSSFTEEVDLDSFHLWGWSTGGAVAMTVAADHPDRVQKLVLLAPASTRGYPIYRKDEQGQPTDERLTTKEEIAADPVQVAPVRRAQQTGDTETLRGIWDALIYTHDEPDPERYERYLEDMCTQRNLVDVDYALVHFNLSEEHNGVTDGNGKAGRIDAPTLVLRGDRDQVITEEMAEQVVADIGENAELVVLADCGHSPFVDDLDGLIETVTSFLEG